MRVPPRRLAIAGPCILPPKRPRRAPYVTCSGSPHRTAADTHAQGKPSGAAAREVDQPAEDALAVRAQAVVDELVRDPGPQPADRGHGLFGERLLDVEV